MDAVLSDMWTLCLVTWYTAMVFAAFLEVVIPYCWLTVVVAYFCFFWTIVVSQLGLLYKLSFFFQSVGLNVEHLHMITLYIDLCKIRLFKEIKIVMPRTFLPRCVGYLRLLWIVVVDAHFVWSSQHLCYVIVCVTSSCKSSGNVQYYCAQRTNGMRNASRCAQRLIWALYCYCILQPRN